MMHRILQRSCSEPPHARDDLRTAWSSPVVPAVNSKCPPAALLRPPALPVLLQASLHNSSSVAEKVQSGPRGHLQFPSHGINRLDRPEFAREPISVSASRGAYVAPCIGHNPQTWPGPEASTGAARLISKKTTATLANEIAQAVATAAKTAVCQVLADCLEPQGEQNQQLHTDVHRRAHDASVRPGMRRVETHLSLGTSVASIASHPTMFLHGFEEAVCTELMNSYLDGVHRQRQQVSNDVHCPTRSAPASVSAFAKRGKSASGMSGISDIEASRQLQNEANEDVGRPIPCSCVPLPYPSSASDDTSEVSSQTSMQPTEISEEARSKEVAVEIGNADSSEDSHELQNCRGLKKNGRHFPKMWRTTATSRRDSFSDSCSKIWSTTDSNMTLQGLRSKSDRRLSDMALPENFPTQKSDFDPSASLGSASHVLHLHGYWATLWLQFWGVMPAFSCNVPPNQICCTFIALWIVVDNVSRLWLLRLEKHWQIAVGDLLLSLCALGCLFACRSLHQCGLLGRRKAVLLQYAQQRGFLPQWKAQSQRNVILSAIAWCVIVLSRAMLESLSSELRVPQMGFEYSESFSMAAVRCVRILMFAFTIGVVTASVLYVLHYLTGLLLAIGAFCVQCTDQGADYDVLKMDWNILQALLRRASLLMSPGIVWLVLGAASLFFSNAASLLFERPEPTCSLPAVVPVFLLVVWIYRMLWMAASVTSTCLRMPPFINSLALSGNKWEKQSLIEYVKNSAAGFYVQESILTAEIVLKMLYLSIVVVFTIVSKISTEKVVS